jgi:hypothetical protein
MPSAMTRPTKGSRSTRDIRARIRENGDRDCSPRAGQRRDRILRLGNKASRCLPHLIYFAPDMNCTTRTQRIRRWLLVIIGLALSLSMAVISFFFGSAVLYSGQPGHGEYIGTHQFTVRVLELFATVFVFGLVALAGGIFQLRRGRTSIVTMFLLLGLVVLMFYLGQTIVKPAH